MPNIPYIGYHFEERKLTEVPLCLFGRLLFHLNFRLLNKANEHDFLIIEDDYEFESNFLGQPHPALRSLDTENRVIYISCLSKVLASGVQLGFIVAESAVIDELKKLVG